MAKLHISCIDILNLFHDKRYTKNSFREGVCEKESFYLCVERTLLLRVLLYFICNRLPQPFSTVVTTFDVVIFGISWDSLDIL